MFKSIFNLGKDIVEIAAAPVEVAADITRGITKPLAEAAKETTEEIKKDLEVND